MPSNPVLDRYNIESCIDGTAYLTHLQQLEIAQEVISFLTVAATIVQSSQPICRTMNARVVIRKHRMTTAMDIVNSDITSTTGPLFWSPPRGGEPEGSIVTVKNDELWDKLVVDSSLSVLNK